MSKKDELSELAIRANESHDGVREAIRSAISHARQAGMMLIKAKRLVECNWTDWLEENFHASVETARVYMRVASRWSEIELALEENPDLTLEDAKRILMRENRKTGKPSTYVPGVEQTKKQLVHIFKQRVDVMPDEAIDFLQSNWENLWASILQYMRDSHQVDFDDPKTYPHTLPAVTNDVLDVNDEWNKGK